MNKDLLKVFDPEDYFLFYKADLEDENLIKKQIKFINEECLKGENKKILDLCCGFGRISNELGKLGHDVTGVDIIEGFLDYARAKAEQSKINIQYINKDMREISFTDDFDVVINIFTSFGYFSDQENEKVLKNVYKSLRKGGLFLLDIPNRDNQIFKMGKMNSQCFYQEKNGSLMIDFLEFNSEDGVLLNNRIITKGGHIKKTPLRVKLYNLNEIAKLFNQTGFKILRYFGNWDKGKVDLINSRIIIIGEKE